jgi:hypothetical protein
MKKLLIVLLLLVYGVSFSQENKKTLDEKVNITLDSLSKVYNKRICGYGYVSYRGVKKTRISYVEDGKLITEVIKVEYINPPQKKEE